MIRTARKLARHARHRLDPNYRLPRTGLRIGSTPIFDGFATGLPLHEYRRHDPATLSQIRGRSTVEIWVETLLPGGAASTVFSLRRGQFPCRSGPSLRSGIFCLKNWESLSPG